MRPAFGLQIAVWLGLLLGLNGCDDVSAKREPPGGLSRCVFERDVYAVLVRDCGFAACHGNANRFFQVLGPGRGRLDPMSAPYEPPSQGEVDRTFDRAVSMLTADEVSDSLLLQKPLERSAHMGLDGFGRNVYASKDDPAYQTIARWAEGGGQVCP